MIRQLFGLVSRPSRRELEFRRDRELVQLSMLKMHLLQEMLEPDTSPERREFLERAVFEVGIQEEELRRVD